MNENFVEVVEKIVPMAMVNLTYALTCVILGIISIVLGMLFIDKLFFKHIKQVISENPMAVSVFYGLFILGISLSTGIIIGLTCS